MIHVQNVFKYFGHFKALDDICFEIKSGEIVGFLGQNGAGKTTLMRIVTGFLKPTSGKVIIDGNDMAQFPLKIKQKIGYLPENPPLYPVLTVKEYLRFAAQLREIPAKEQNREIERAMMMCDLKQVSSKEIGILSKGFRQRVGIAQAIIHDPAVLILDEPTSGLDPVQNLSVRKLIKDLEHKRTVILSTHILSEIEQIAKRVLVIKDGSIIIDQELADWMKESSANSLEDLFVKTVSS